MGLVGQGAQGPETIKQVFEGPTFLLPIVRGLCDTDFKGPRVLYTAFRGAQGLVNGLVKGAMYEKLEVGPC